MGRRRIRIKIYGTVQGVGFRWSASRKARELGLTGFVRNCSDGCVETEVEGDEEAVANYRAWCAKGPRFGQVVKVEEKWLEASGEYNEFEIW